MNKETMALMVEIFGEEKVSYYQAQIKKALNSEDKYEADHGMIHCGIVLYINSVGDFISKAMIYATLEAFIEGKDSIDLKDILIPCDPIEILELAKKYIDEKEKGND